MKRVMWEYIEWTIPALCGLNRVRILGVLRRRAAEDEDIVDDAADDYSR